MSAVHGRLTRILHGAFDLSGFLNSHIATSTARALDATPYQATGKRYVSDFRDGSLQMKGFFEADETDEDRLDDVLQAAIDDATPNPVTIAPEGDTSVGNRGLLMEAVEIQVNVEAPVAELVMNQATFRGQIDSGVVLAPLAAYTATANGTSVDNGASSANGGVAHQHVTLVSGTSPTNTTIVQHSSDNSTFADLITFSEKTAAGSERATVTGTVNRYVRARRVIGGSATPTFTQAISFARL